MSQDPVVRSPSLVEEQELRFLDNVVPPVGSGLHRVTITQTVSWDSSSADVPPFVHQTEFEVDGPRFRLDAGDVKQTFPSPGSLAADPDALPYVVFNRLTLPWERAIDPKDHPDLDGTPWLALLVFDEGQILPPASPNPADAGNYSLEEIVSPPSRILGSGLPLTDAEKTLRGEAIDIRASDFSALLPTFDELRWLAHSRQVDTTDKVIDGDAEADGWFSIVMANRFPAPGARSIVHLTSLEGFAAYLEGQPLDGYDAVRLPSLLSWTFSGAGATGNFPSLMEHLSSGLLEMPRRDLPPPSPGENDARAIVESGFSDGYAPVTYRLRLGEASIGWYRGPLLPVQTRDASLDPFFAAEDGLVYDERTGLFDVSYAVAWQIGRLLALSDRGFVDALLAWRNETRATLHLLRARIARRGRLGRVLPNDEEPLGWLRTDTTNAGFRRFLIDLLGRPREGDEVAPFGAPVDPSGLLDRLHRLPGVVDPDVMASLLESGDDPAAALLDYLRDVRERAHTE